MVSKSTYACKVYVVQKTDRQGTPQEVLAVKLTHSTAHEIAKAYAPARVICVMADKTISANALGAAQNHPI